MDDISVDVLEAVIAHTADQEPRSNVRVLLNGQRLLTLAASIYVECRKVARELATIFSYQPPLGKFFLLRALNIETSNLISSKLKPVHVVCEVQHQVVLFRVLFKKLALCH